MSHFTVAVFTKENDLDEVKRLLEPYNENLEIEHCIEDGEDYWFNPKARWDWYTVGGRWLGMLKLKEGKVGSKGSSGAFGNSAKIDEFDSCLVSDLDFEAMVEKRLKALEPFETCFARKFYKPEYFERMYPSEDFYVKANTRFSTYAVITPDGEWHSSGNMGWFGCSSETPEEKHSFNDKYYDNFIKPALNNGWYITIVDCHI